MAAGSAQPGPPTVTTSGTARRSACGRRVAAGLAQQTHASPSRGGFVFGTSQVWVQVRSDAQPWETPLRSLAQPRQGRRLRPAAWGRCGPWGALHGHERGPRAPGSVEGPAGGRGGPSAGEEVGVSGPGRVSEVGAARGGSRPRCPRRGGTSRIRKKEGPVAGETSAGTGADVAQEARSSPRPLLALAARREAAAGGLRAGSEAGQRLPVPVQVPVPASAPGSGRFGPLSLKSLSVSVSSSLSHPTSCCYPPPPLTASVSTSVSSSASGRLCISISISCSLPPSIYSFPCLTLAASLSLWLSLLPFLSQCLTL